VSHRIFLVSNEDATAVCGVAGHAQAFVLDAEFAYLVEFQEIEGEAADDGDVFGGVTCADVASVFN
jgi:hypothetical protein